ncbi:hypothetical protein BDV95DRAFT_605152 [Massariosphaeria phaeospora]|uniref:Uncharacterized protein n=1 Tax=Massariosphaeria phaeospora TaxID=100035 RepID=A0A7C8IGJ2_9PLEO|nr:hypothetical protein BDV95DRAFT_605152 [Massariosphaeria phaeospora]
MQFAIFLSLLPFGFSAPNPSASAPTIFPLLRPTPNAPVPSSLPSSLKARSAPRPGDMPPLEVPAPTWTAAASTPLMTTSMKATIQNSCGYELWVASVQKENGPMTEIHRISPGQTYQETLRPIIDETSCKWNTGTTQEVWYDISLIDCVDKNNVENLTMCAGHESGLQAAVGTQDDGSRTCRTFTCAPGEFCQYDAYLYEENLNRPWSPNIKCPAEKGVIFEFCRNLRP